MKQYKVVPGPQSVQVKKGNTTEAFSYFEKIINQYAAAGWTYHSMETITVSEKAGCFGKDETAYYYMLIFERDA